MKSTEVAKVADQVEEGPKDKEWDGLIAKVPAGGCRPAQLIRASGLGRYKAERAIKRELEFGRLRRVGRTRGARLFPGAASSTQQNHE